MSRVVACCRPLPRVAASRSCSATLSFAIATSMVDFCPFDVRRTFVRCLIDIRLTSDIYRTFIRRPIDVRPTSVRHLSDFHPTIVLPSCVLSSCTLSSYVLPFYHPVFSSYIYLTFIRPSLDVRLTSARCLSGAGYSQRHTVFFKSYVVFLASDVYYHKILGHGTTPCPRMMKALPLS